jgi:cobalt transporter subunit CbtB
MAMIKETTKPQNQAAVERTTSRMPAILALVFGAFIVLGAGFSHSSTVHDAAHDVRHAFAFPCH